MAKMFPPSIDPSAKFTSGELDTYMFLKHILPDNYCVFYNIRINNSYPDFVIISPELGLVTLEVKDWSLDFILNTNVEVFELNNGTTEPNPQKKSENFRNTIENVLKTESNLLQIEGIYEGRLKFPRCAGVVFPNIKRTEFINSEHRNSINQNFILFNDDIQTIFETRNTELLISKLKNMFVSERSFNFQPLSLDDMETITKLLYKDSSFFREKEKANSTNTNTNTYKPIFNDYTDIEIPSTGTKWDVKKKKRLKYPPNQHGKKRLTRRIVLAALLSVFIFSLLPNFESFTNSSFYQYTNNFINQKFNVASKGFDEESDIVQPSMLLKVNNNPYGKGTYILIQDGTSYLISETMLPGYYIEFFNDKRIIVYDDNDSIRDEFIAEDDVVKFEVGNAYTKIYLNGDEHRFVKNFKYDFVSREITK